MKYIVYLTENVKCQINGQNCIYVGVHRTSNPFIFDGYIGCGVKIQQPSSYMYPKTPFQYAVKKYGTDAFRRTILYIFNTEKDAYDKEREIVDENFIKLAHTYNAIIGGKVEDRFKPLYQFDFEGNLVKTWERSADAYEFYGIDGRQFQSPKSYKTDFLGYFWSTSKEININEYKVRTEAQKTTYVYSKEGKLILQFESMRACSEYFKKNIGTIYQAIKRASLIRGKYYLSFKLVDYFIPKPRIQYSQETFYAYYKDGSFLGSYKGKEIMPIIHLNSWSKISNIFQVGNNWYKDYYVTFEPINEVPSKKYVRKLSIDVYDKFGNFIESMDSVKSVREKYKVPASKIQHIQQGDRYFGDYIFKYNSK